MDRFDKCACLRKSRAGKLIGVLPVACKKWKSAPKLFAAVALAWTVQAAFVLSSAKAIESFEVPGRPFWVIDEVRAGAFKQAIDDAPHEGGPALNLEVLFGRLPGRYGNDVLDFFLTPRPHIGTTLAFGKTDEFYWGVTWDAKVFERTFFEASFGGAVHDGPLDTLGEASYGCRVNFRESASLGYALTPEWRIMGTIDHMSQAGICQPNRGLTNAGIRLGYKF